MKIIAVGRNYVEHAKELNNPVPTEPVIFMKPDTAVIRNNKPFFIPDFSADVHHEVEIVIRICKDGKNVEEKFAHKYYDEIGIGLDFTARDIQSKCKTKGLPWELAKGFDGSAPLGKFVQKNYFKDLRNINFRLDINGETKQSGNTRDLIFSFEFIIAFVSKYFTLRVGDLIFTGTPEGVGPVKAGDKLEAFIENEKMLECAVK
jgi:2-keto-4-pentenoate hydratase/2-oxohepta-3-ene-1,7-dioic acid hydratase in catechol pathway